MLIRTIILLTGLVLVPAQGVVLFQLETFDGPTGWTAEKPPSLSTPSPPARLSSVPPDRTGRCSRRTTSSCPRLPPGLDSLAIKQ